jgi:copper chaperone CopZ
MKKMANSIMLLFFFVSCHEQVNSLTKEQQNLDASFTNILKKINPVEPLGICKAYLVIPNTGCSGCINSAEELLKSVYPKTKTIKFILTNIVSIKMLNLKLKIDVRNNEKILLDTENYFGQSRFNSIYPQIFFINQKTGSVYKRMEVSPTEDGLSELSKIL